MIALVINAFDIADWRIRFWSSGHRFNHRRRQIHDRPAETSFRDSLRA